MYFESQCDSRKMKLGPRERSLTGATDFNYSLNYTCGDENLFIARATFAEMRYLFRCLISAVFYFVTEQEGEKLFLVRVAAEVNETFRFVRVCDTFFRRPFGQRIVQICFISLWEGRNNSTVKIDLPRRRGSDSA